LEKAKTPTFVFLCRCRGVVKLLRAFEDEINVGLHKWPSLNGADFFDDVILLHTRLSCRLFVQMG
jgi:hypothetical protein